MKAVIVANGIMSDFAPFHAVLTAADLVVAADGGARALIDHGIQPGAVGAAGALGRQGLAGDRGVGTLVGDLDSLPAHLVERWRAGGGRVLSFPTEKDETDLELALRHAREQGARQIAILGALGGRADHAMANLLLLAAPLLDHVEAAVLDDGLRVVAVRHTLDLLGKPGDLLSLLPLTHSADGIVTEGLRYPLRGESLPLGTPRGVSNVFVSDRVTVRVAQGMVLAFHSWADARRHSW